MYVDTCIQQLQIFQTQKNGWDGPVLGVKQATENKRQFDEEVSIFSLKLKIFMWRIETMLIADVLGTESWPEHDRLAIWNQQGCIPGTVESFK